MGSFTSMDMMIVVFLIIIIVVLVAIIGIMDIVARKKMSSAEESIDIDNKEREKYTELFNEEVAKLDEAITEDVTVNEPLKNNTNHVEEIRYVEEDEELEKTKAKLELEQLKEDLIRQEEMEKMDTSKTQTVVEEPIEVKLEAPRVIETEASDTSNVKDSQVEDISTEKEEVSVIASAINEDLAKETKEADLTKVNAIQEDLNELLQMSIDEKIARHEDEQEEKAIISVDQFNQISDALYDDNAVVQDAYQDEGDEPISLDELAALYNTREMASIKLDDFATITQEKKDLILANSDIKTMEELPPIAPEKKFKSTPVISPVYGITKDENKLELEQTADLDKLNEEIKKTNEFLRVLKELQKNLD